MVDLLALTLAIFFLVLCIVIPSDYVIIYNNNDYEVTDWMNAVRENGTDQVG